jgi:hypothetical protein
MNSSLHALAVIGRELRAESRRPHSYWLRVLAAGGIILLFGSFVVTSQLDAAYIGGALFDLLHWSLVVACWVLTPLMTADCISRERREGTLGLLFLTPLRPMDVILGKSGVHILRVLTLFVAALPILGMPFVLGGVAWQMALPALADIGGAVLLGIASGLYASIQGGSMIQVMVRAEAYAAGLALVSAMLTAFGTGNAVAAAFSGWALTGPFLLLLMKPTGDLILFMIIFFRTTRALEKNWQEEAGGTEQPKWVKIFSGSEFWREVFHWNTSQTLDHNPMAWLQEYSWTARLTKWAWFLGLGFAELVLLASGDERGLLGLQPVVASILASGIAFSAAGSFRRERQDGLLELLLVTPLSTWRVLGGRVWGICCHFLPATGVLVVLWTGDHYLNPKLYKDTPDLPFANPFAFTSLLAFGLFLSLRRINTLLAWALTCLAGFLIPALVTTVLVASSRLDLATALFWQSCYQIVLTVTFGFLLYRNLSTRAFAV